MQRFLMSIAACCVAGAAWAADPIEGLWQTAPDDNGNTGLVQVTPCAKGYCGVLIKAFGPSGGEIASQNIGRQVIWDTVSKGGGVYRGRVFAPDRGKTYKSKLVLSGGNLSVSGCVLGVCREGGVWVKQ